MGMVINNRNGEPLCEVGMGPNAYYAVVLLKTSLDIPLAPSVPCQMPGDERQGFTGQNLMAHFDAGTPMFARGHVGDGLVKLVVPTMLGLGHGLVLNLTVPADLVDVVPDDALELVVTGMGFGYEDNDIPEEVEELKDGPERTKRPDMKVLDESDGGD